MKLLTSKELALRWSMSPKTLANWRVQKQGPKFIRIGNRIRYQLEIIERFEQRGMASQASLDGQ